MAIKKIKLPNNTTVDVEDSRISASDITSWNGKADKVASATNGNFAGLDSNGNLTDSGSKASDFLTQHQSLAGYWNNTNSGTTSYDWKAKSLTLANNYGLYCNNTSSVAKNVLAVNSYNHLVIGTDVAAGGYSTVIYGNDIQLRQGTSGDTVGFVLKSSGNVGIGTNSPLEKLDVSGNIKASGTITPGSDSRIKDNQEDISKEKAFGILEQLQPKSWTWNEDAGENLVGKKAAGLVAQEVKDILPDAVTISETDKIKDFHALNYNTIQGYEIAAIKGLIEEVKSLKAEIAELKKQIK